ncbi:MAG: xanthine dehydrogenase accessory protein XdhC [Rhizobiaceae bacterium]
MRDLAISYADFEKIRDRFNAGEPVILVHVQKTDGSAPRESGTVMGVTTEAICGTIGGGQLEWLAMDRARKMITNGESSANQDIPLGPEIGQCCGGRVQLYFQLADDGSLQLLEESALQARRELHSVYVFGAGHTGLALASLLTHVPVESMLIDTREDAIAKAGEEINTRLAAVPEAIVHDAKPGSSFVTMTHEHSLDFLITAEALKRGDACYCGMIGSATKRAVFLNWLNENGYDRLIAEKLVCPIGGKQVKDKRPEIIAALTMAEILTAIHTAASGEI